MLDLIIFLGLVVIGYFTGRSVEKAHYKSIRNRERASLWMEIHTRKTLDPSLAVNKAILVSGSAVISVDYFKMVAAGLRNFFGGRVTAYESLLDRARREAILRMKDMARKSGAKMIINVKLETSTINGSKGRGQSVKGVEVLAYGTAISLR